MNTNLVPRDAVINNIQTLIAQATLDETGSTGSTLDLTDTRYPKHIALVMAGTPAEVTNVFIKIEESDEGTVWFRLTQIQVSAAGFTQHAFTRTRRRIRAVVSVETPASPTDPAIPLAVLLIS